MRIHGACAAPALLSAVLAAAGSGCADAEPCNGLRTVHDFRTCRPLCGDATTAVECDAGRPRDFAYLLEDWFHGAMEMQGHVFPADDPDPNRWLGYWEILDVASPDAIEFVQMPGDWIPSTRPPAKVRVTMDPYLHLPAGVTFYMHATAGTGLCLLHYGVVAHWVPLSDARDAICLLGGYWDVSYMVLDAEGCEDPPLPGSAAKRIGVIVLDTHVSRDLCEQLTCGRDGECNILCRVDYDCPCHYDGACSVDTCMGDAECACEADGHCIPGCDGDPDCACMPDGECNPVCGAHDPDCPCGADGACSLDCLGSDPDCGCADDGSCNPACGLFDPDCACREDGYCNPECEDGEDPDCGGGGP